MFRFGRCTGMLMAGLTWKERNEAGGLMRNVSETGKVHGGLQSNDSANKNSGKERVTE